MNQHPTPPNRIGRIDLHSHLLPGVDDGCPDVTESLACARRMVEAGYTHSFCTPHIWPNLPGNTPETIAQRTAKLQSIFQEENVPLRVMPGGELNLRPDIVGLKIERIPTFGMARRHCLFDIWVDRIPSFFWEAVKWLQSLKLTVILAHPERMRAVQDDPKLVDRFAEAGLLLQGNLQCLADPPLSHTRLVVERLLKERRYFALASDLHNLAGLPIRFQGLKRAIELVGQAEVWKLTHEQPKKILGAASTASNADPTEGGSS